MQKVTDKFRLRAANRSTHEAVMLQKQIDTTTPGDQGRQYVDGAKEYRLADGRHLNCIDDYTFEVATTGELLTRVALRDVLRVAAVASTADDVPHDANAVRVLPLDRNEVE
jgi:hypothetical protein